MFYFIALKILWMGIINQQPAFREQVIDNNISIGYGIALGDVDGDKKPDILLADKKQFVWYRNGDWKKFVMVENLTEHDNVCIAAKDINGDGKVEVAVGAQWNPGETSNDAQSGSVHYLVRPDDPTQRWEAVALHHEPTIHRMQWVRLTDNKYYLVVVPLHGRGNKAGEGAGVKIIAYEYPKNVKEQWRTYSVDETMHLTHNLEIVESKNGAPELYIAGKEGIALIGYDMEKKSKTNTQPVAGMNHSAGEVRVGKATPGTSLIATIEPMHGNELAVYSGKEKLRTVIDDNIKEGHALAVADFLGTGSDQVVAGWRLPNRDGKVGVKLYVKKGAQGQWESQWIDENGMACEDIKVMDLNADGKPDIVASGRATHNLKVYWNR